MKDLIDIIRQMYRHYERLWHKEVRHHKLLLPVVAFASILGLTLLIFLLLYSHPASAANAHTVVFWHDKKTEMLPTRAQTVDEFIKKYGLQLNPGDVVEPALTTDIVEDNFHINVYRAQPVMIIDQGQRTFALSAATTARSITKQVGIDVYPEDTLDTTPSDDFVGEGGIGKKIVIERATPANLNLYGAALKIRTHAKTVGALLAEKHVKLAGDDTVQPALETPLAPETQIFVVRNGSQVVTKEEPIAMQTQTIEDSSLSFGTTAVRQQGSPGKRSVTYQVDLQNGKEIGRHVIQEVVTQQPVAQIIARGKAVAIPSDREALMAQAGIASSDYGYVNYIISRESGWCPTKTQGQVGYCPGYAPASVPSGLGYGLCQATPGTKMSSAGADWMTNPVTQLRWCTGYAGRYGGWAGAYNFWVAHSWW